MDENKHPRVSVRLCRSDLERIEKIAGRLHVRESEIVRFALRLAFTKLAPLLDLNARGQELIPIFLECGPELTRHFDLDPRTLDAIINDGLETTEKRVDYEDLELIATLHMPVYHPRTRVGAPPKQEAAQLGYSGALQHYLYQKYIEPENRHAVLNYRTSSLRTPL
ncbi:MAG: hypothetical protein ACYDBW_04685 [Sulfuricaulis sp.]